MEDDEVLVPPEVEGGLEQLQRAGALEPGDRQRAVDVAAERGLDATVKWLEQVGDGVYERTARGAFVAADEA